ncbi:MAG: anhydro-N-acetylmuramic acid kinase [Rhodospirillales bacterium]|nr:anhydro-N-acetylmuramic acid kinase [Rhodospirillales bacterium]
MIHKKIHSAIGLMSGTSFDGVDIAWIKTDGEASVTPLAAGSYPYSPEDRGVIRAVLGQSERGSETDAAEKIVTERHIAYLDKFLSDNNIDPRTVDVIGFHGQTIFHDPGAKFTWQIGDAQALADVCGLPVVGQMRVADVQAGGQGAPLLPLYHRALAHELDKLLAILNIGGVSNITWIGEGEILAFDCGPGNALLDDFVSRRTGLSYDRDGLLASAGRADEALLFHWMAHPYFVQKPPKSLDRDAWDVKAVEKLADAHGAATLLEFTVRSIEKGISLCPKPPRAVYVTGGGRHNGFLMKRLQALFQVPVAPVEALGWQGDVLEAQGFAYLAVRSLLGLPLTEPGTTGVPKPLTGGVLYHPQSSARQAL